MGNNYRPGSHLWICDRCGFQYHAEEKRREWNGLIVCPECWEPRHPQDFVKAKVDRQSVTDPRPEAADTFVGPSFLLLSDGSYFGFSGGGKAIRQVYTEVSL